MDSSRMPQAIGRPKESARELMFFPRDGTSVCLVHNCSQTVNYQPRINRPP